MIETNITSDTMYQGWDDSRLSIPDPKVGPFGNYTLIFGRTLCILLFSVNFSRQFQMKSVIKIQYKPPHLSNSLHQQTACVHHQPGVCRVLMQRGADPTLRHPRTGWVPLHEAATRGHTSCIQEIVAQGAPIHPRNVDNDTPLDLARRYEQNSTIAFLSKLKKLYGGSGILDFKSNHHP